MQTTDQFSESDENFAKTLNELLNKYAGLKITEDSDESPPADPQETISIVEWVRLDFLGMTLKKTDYPEMGYVTYKEKPSP
jgi:hypothetical protein